MRKLFSFRIALTLVILLTLAFAGTASASVVTGDGTWQWTSPSVQGNTLEGVSFLDANTGWAVGAAGTVLKTTDGGTSWVAQIPSPNNCAGFSPYGSGCNLTGVNFVDANNGWVVGDYGTIWHTINGGSSWTAQTLSNPLNYTNLKNVNFFNTSNGLAVGSGYSFGTVNGGSTWTQITGISSSNYNDQLASVRMIDANTAFAVGEQGAVYKITQAGGVWTATQQALSGGTPITSANLQSVYFTDANHGFAIGSINNSGRLLRTVDGGVNWQLSSTVPVTGPWSVTVNGNDLVVTGPSGAIYKRSAATNWTDPLDTVASELTATNSNSTSLIWAATFPGSSTTGFAVGAGGTILKSTDSGSNWSPLAGVGNDKKFNGSSFISDTTGWMVASEHSIVKTADAGATWTSDNAGIPSGVNLKSVSFLNETTGYVVGTLSGAGKAYKYNSGTWSEITLPAGVAQLWGIHMVDATHGWMVGFAGGGAPSGVALKTTDGSNWAYDATGLATNIQLYGVDATSTSNGWAVGQNTTTMKGVIARYSGGAWTVTEKSDSNTLISIDMVNASTGFIAGFANGTGGNFADGKAFKTTDGSTFNPMTVNLVGVPLHSMLIAVSFVNANVGYMAGGEGHVFKTVNGTDWVAEGAGSSVGVNTLSAMPATWTASGYAAFAGGDSGEILRTAPAALSVTSVSPGSGANKIHPAANVTATFNKPMNAASITGSSFTLTRHSDSAPVAGAVSYDAGTKTATFNPGADLTQGALYDARLTTAITDSEGNHLASDYTWSFTVDNPPVLAAIGNKSVDEGVQLSFTATATDPDAGTVFTYSGTNLPSGASINPTTGVFTWTPSYSQANTYLGVVIQVADSTGLTDSETITITVNDVNGPPILSAIGNRTVNENSLLTFTATATDPDPGTVFTYSGTNLPSGATIDAVTGIFDWTPDYTQSGVYSGIVITVADNGSPVKTDTETISITVNNTVPPVDPALIDRYNALGGSAVLGVAIDVAHDVTGGKYQDFAYGNRLVRNNSKNAVYRIQGAILAKYQEPAVNSALGLPTSDEYGVSSGRANDFTSGKIYWSAATWAHEVHGPILEKFLAIGGPGVYGFPKTDVTDISGITGVAGALESDFQGVNIYSSPGGTFEVHGSILAKYIAAGGAATRGLPTSNETGVSGVAGARMNSFTGANVYWSPWTGAHIVYGAIMTKLNDMGAAAYGLPISDVFNVPGVAGAEECDLERARLYNSTNLGIGAHEVHGLILYKYLTTGGPSWFGVPTTDEMDPAIPGVFARYNSFQYASVYWSPETSAHTIYGPILDKYTATGGPTSYLGLPTTDTTLIYTAGATGGMRSTFQGGHIYRDDLTGNNAYIVKGVILANYLATGGPGWFGTPLTDELSAGMPARFAQYNDFRFASTYWSPETGPHTIYGPILNKYNTAGGPVGSGLGLPTTDTTLINAAGATGGMRSTFENGHIYRDDLTGNSAFIVKGAILAKYLASGGPAWFGVPLTDETNVISGASGASDKYNLFRFAGIYYADAPIGAHINYGAIWDKYRAAAPGGAGGPAGLMGVPITDEYSAGSTRRVDYEVGYIDWTSATGAVQHMP